MANIAAYVVGFTGWGPDQHQVNVQVSWVDTTGVIVSRGFDLPVSVAALADEINRAIQNRARETAESHGMVLGPDDVIRVVGGAVPNVT